jgi:DinB superfamily
MNSGLNSECHRIAGQLRRAFAGDPWHGSPLRDLLADVTAGQASSHPLASAHSIWELVSHIELYVRIALEATHGIAMPKLFGTEKDWPAVEDHSPAAWAAATDRLLHSAEQLALAIEGFEDARLQNSVPGREYDFYYLFHGVVQHSLYHGGQIALLRKHS